jgi:hypothetical protein
LRSARALCVPALKGPDPLLYAVPTASRSHLLRDAMLLRLAFVDAHSLARQRFVHGVHLDAPLIGLTQ